MENSFSTVFPISHLCAFYHFSFAFMGYSIFSLLLTFHSLLRLWHCTFDYDGIVYRSIYTGLLDTLWTLVGDENNDRSTPHPSHNSPPLTTCYICQLYCPLCLPQSFPSKRKGPRLNERTMCSDTNHCITLRSKCLYLYHLAIEGPECQIVVNTVAQLKTIFSLVLLLGINWMSMLFTWRSVIAVKKNVTFRGHCQLDSRNHCQQVVC